MIPIQNIYYMLSYAFQTLSEQGYKKLATEQFDNVAELCAAILSKGISVQIKRGLGREYLERTEPLSSPRGRINLSESITTRSFHQKQLVCSYDDFSVDSYLNRILKTTMLLLLRSDLSKARKKELRRLLVYFDEVGVLELHSINWNVQFNRNNQTYRMLISICWLVVKGLLQTNDDGSTRLMEYLDEQRMCRLYEKFLLEYYRKEFPQIAANASQIPWVVDDGVRTMLPIMQSDITLKYKEKVLIIDAKYYSQITVARYDSHTVRSGNLYQIFTYVKNMEAELSGTQHEVAGMLLYAQTDEAIQPNQTYRMSGNQISVESLDLNCDFSMIAAQLNEIIADYFRIGVCCCNGR